MAMWCSHFLVFHFDCMQTGDTTQHRLALYADAAGYGYRWFLRMWLVWQWIHWIYCHSHTTITMALKLAPITFIRRNPITKWRFNFSYILPLFFSSCLSMFSEGCIFAWFLECHGLWMVGTYVSGSVYEKIVKTLTWHDFQNVAAF